MNAEERPDDRQDASELRADVSELRADVSQVRAEEADERLVALEQAGLDHEDRTGRQQDDRALVGEDRAEVSEQRADDAQDRADVAELRADVSQTRADVSEVRADVSEVRANRAAQLATENRDRIVALEDSDRFKRMETQVDAFQRSRKRFLVGVIVAMAMASAAIYQLTQANEAAELEVIRSCIRNNVNSALVSGPATRVPLRVTKNLYPIVDCRATLESGAAVRLDPAQSKVYIQLVFEGRAPVIRDGKVVGSRMSILDGVSSIRDVGKPR